MILMALAKIQNIIGTAVHVAGDDIDTDRIIPARFMKCLTFDGLGEFLFYDARHDNEGKEKTHPLNDPFIKMPAFSFQVLTLDAEVQENMPHNPSTEPAFEL